MFSFGNKVISWINKKQPIDNTELEYWGAIVVAYKAIWLKRLLKDFNELINKLILVHYNNVSNI